MSESVRPQLRPEGLGSPTEDLEQSELGAVRPELRPTSVVNQAAVDTAQQNGEPVTNTSLLGEGLEPNQMGDGLSPKLISSMFKFEDVSSISTLDVAKAQLRMLDTRSRMLLPDSEFGGQDEYDKVNRPLLMAKIEDLTKLPDFPTMLTTDGGRAKIKMYADGGWQSQEYATANPELLKASVLRAKEILADAQHLPTLSGDLASLKIIREQIDSGGIRPENIPDEYLESLNKATNKSLADELAKDIPNEWLYSRDRNKEELIAVLDRIEEVGGPEHLMAIKLRTAITNIEGDVTWGMIARDKITAENYFGAARRAASLGNMAYAEEITLIGERLLEEDPDNNDMQIRARAAAANIWEKGAPIRKGYEATSSAFVSAASSAQNLVEIAAKAPQVLTMSGSLIPKVMSSLTAELATLNTIFGSGDGTASGPAEAEIQTSSALAELTAYEKSLREEFESGNVNMSDLEYYGALFRAQETRMAFELAILQQGPAGVVSNQDFNNALSQIRQSKKQESYSDSLRGLVRTGLTGVQSAYNAVLNDSSTQGAIEMLKEGGVESNLYQAAVRNIEERFIDVGKGKAWGWVSGPPIGAPSSVSTGVGPNTNLSDEDLTDEDLINIVKDWQDAHPDRNQPLPNYLTVEQMQRYQALVSNNGGE